MHLIPAHALCNSRHSSGFWCWWGTGTRAHLIPPALAPCREHTCCPPPRNPRPRPADISKIQERVDDAHYVNKKGFQDDITLMCENCKTFNPPTSSYHRSRDTSGEVNFARGDVWRQTEWRRVQCMCITELCIYELQSKCSCCWRCRDAVKVFSFVMQRIDAIIEPEATATKSTWQNVCEINRVINRVIR